ncbi:hypothetical protein TNCV_4389051 [Trichonephila clavipes]|nr:hypothetical protein TNCV_4389051 [Trichonephila clavipes]
MVSTTDVFNSTISGLSSWMQSNCKTTVKRFPRNSSKRSSKQPLSTCVIVRLKPSSDPVQMLMLCGDLGRPSW